MLPRLSTARAAVRTTVERFPTLERGVELATAAAGVPARLARALAEVENLLARLGPLLDRMEDLTERAAGVLEAAGEAVGQAAGLNREATAVVYDASAVSAAAQALVTRATGVTEDAARTMAGAARTAERADALLRRYEPIAGKAAPLAEKFVDGLTAAEVDAAIKLVDELPRLTDHLRDDILPILASLERAGPDISELVKVSYDVRRAILGIPGFGFFKKRGEEALSDVEDETLLEEGRAPVEHAVAPEPLPDRPPKP